MSSLCAPGELIAQVVPDKYENPGTTHHLSCADMMSINQRSNTDTIEVRNSFPATDLAIIQPAIPRKRPSPVVLEDIADPPAVRRGHRRVGDTEHINTRRRDRALEDQEKATSNRRAARSHSVASSAGTHPSPTPQGTRGRRQSSDQADARGTKAASVEGDDEDKLALRRARNRVAAYKSRAKKNKEVSHLEEDMQRVRDRRAELTSYAEELKSEVFMLKNEILLHGQCDFPPIKQYLMTFVTKLGPGVFPIPAPTASANLPPMPPVPPPPPRMTINRPM